MPARKGSTEPRIFTPPLRPLTRETSLGFSAIDFAREVLHITLRPWQEWLLIHALELDMTTVPGNPEFDPDTPPNRYNDFRFRTVIVEVGRQNGKTVVMVVLGLWRLFSDGAAEILSSAQDLSVAEGTLKSAFTMARQEPELTAFLPWRMDRGEWVPYMRTMNGANAIHLAACPDGLEHVLDVAGEMPKWSVVATNRGGGRSHSAELVLLDELREHLSHDSWNAMVPASRERPRNQAWAFSNAGDSRSVVLRKYRNIGLSAIEQDRTAEEQLGLFEWSAEPGCSIFDPDGWAAANPSMGYGVRTERDMLAEARQAIDPDDTDLEHSETAFRTEYLCQWVDHMSDGRFPSAAWDAARDPDSRRADGSPVYVGIDVGIDAKSCFIVGVSRRADGDWHAEVLAGWPGTALAVEWLAARKGRVPWFDGRVAVNTKQAPATVLVQGLTDAGIEVVEWQGPDVSAATMSAYDIVTGGRLHHRGQPVLDDAVAGSVGKSFGDAWSLDRARSRHDVSPLVAMVAALWLAEQPAARKSAYSADDWDAAGPIEPPDDDDGLLIV